MATIKLTAAQLSTFLTSPMPTWIQEAEVDEEVVLTSSNTACDFAVLENITFNRRVRFENSSIAIGIEFNSCVFKGAISFENYRAKNYVANRMGFHSICFKNCNLEGQLVLLGCQVERGVQLIDCNLGKRLLVDNLVATNGAFEIKSSMAEEIDLHGIRLTGLRFERSEIRGWARFSNVISPGSLVFAQTIFKKSLYIWAGKVNGITSNESIYCEMVRFHAVKNSGILTFSGDNFHKSIQIDTHDQSKNIVAFNRQVHISRSSFGAGFVYNGNDQEIELLTIICSVALIGTITFRSSSIKSTIVKGDNHKGSIFFNSVLFEKLGFPQFNNYGNLVFDTCAATPGKDCTFSLDRSNLGRAQFQNFNFSGFKDVKVVHSLVSNIEFSGVNWFRSIVLDVGTEPDHQSRIRDFYRQLKQASEKQGDKIQALEFHEQEMEAHDFQLGHSGKRWTNSGLNLWLARTNNYGRHWIKPTWLLLISLFVFWVLLVLSVSEGVKIAPARSTSDIIATWGILMEHVSVIPQLLNPTRNLSNIFSNEKLGFWAYFWDALQRIVLTFFVVQIVSAFRKYYRS